MEKEKRNNSKEIIISVLSVLILIVAVVGISYAVWTQTFLGTQENSLNTGYVSFTYTESETNVIAINNAIPIEDEEGKKLSSKNTFFNFTISAKYAGVDSIGYEIYATPITQTLDPKYVKVYLTDYNEVPYAGYTTDVPTFDTLADSTVEGKKLYDGVLTKSGKVNRFRLRVWVSSDYNLPELSKSFSFKVNVKGKA